MNEALEKLVDALSLSLLIVIMIVAFVMCAPANAQEYVKRKPTIVSCGGKIPPVEFSSPRAAVDYAEALPCIGVTWIDINGYYTRGKSPVSSSASSSKSSVASKSSSSVKSSVSSSSASSALSLPAVTATCSKNRENGNELAFKEIGGYDLSCDGRHEKFTQSSCAVSYSTSLPLLTKKCEIAVFDTAGIYSDFVVVVR